MLRGEVALGYESSRRPYSSRPPTLSCTGAAVMSKTLKRRKAAPGSTSQLATPYSPLRLSSLTCTRSVTHVSPSSLPCNSQLRSGPSLACPPCRREYLLRTWRVYRPSAACESAPQVGLAALNCCKSRPRAASDAPGTHQPPRGPQVNREPGVAAQLASEALLAARDGTVLVARERGLGGHCHGHQPFLGRVAPRLASSCYHLSVGAHGGRHWGTNHHHHHHRPGGSTSSIYLRPFPGSRARHSHRNPPGR